MQQDDSDRVSSSADSVPILTGTPQRLHGVVEIASGRGRRIALESPALAVGSAALEGGRAVLRTGRAAGPPRAVPVRLRLRDRQTPPGDYEAYLQAGEERRRVILRVLPDSRIRLAPCLFDIEGAPGQTVEQILHVENLGNVPVDLGVLGLLVLEEENQLCNAIQRSLAKVQSGERGERGSSSQVFLDSVIERLAAARVDRVRVVVPGRPCSVAPGHAESIPVEFHLPSDLKPGSRYSGAISVLRQPLRIHLYATKPDKAPGG